MIDAYDFSAKLKCLFALTVASSGLQLEVVLRKGQRLLDRGPFSSCFDMNALCSCRPGELRDRAAATAIARLRAILSEAETASGSV